MKNPGPVLLKLRGCFHPHNFNKTGPVLLKLRGCFHPHNFNKTGPGDEANYWCTNAPSPPQKGECFIAAFLVGAGGRCAILKKKKYLAVFIV